MEQTFETIKDEKDFSSQLLEAEAFFFDESLPESPSFSADYYSDKNGLVQFIVVSEFIDDPEIMVDLMELKEMLVAITSIVTDYVNRYAEKHGSVYKTDIEVWTLAMSKIPLMAPSTVENQVFARNVEVEDVVSEIVNFILELVAFGDTEAMENFEEFLSMQSEAIWAGVEENKSVYRTITLALSAEVFKVGDAVIYTPKVKMYQIDFDQVNSQFITDYYTEEFVDIDLDYLFAENVFDYEAFEDAEIKKLFESFAQKCRKVEISESGTFFNDEFETTNGDFV